MVRPESPASAETSFAELGGPNCGRVSTSRRRVRRDRRTAPAVDLSACYRFVANHEAPAICLRTCSWAYRGLKNFADPRCYVATESASTCLNRVSLKTLRAGRSSKQHRHAERVARGAGSRHERAARVRRRGPVARQTASGTTACITTCRTRRLRTRSAVRWAQSRPTCSMRCESKVLGET